ncbi:MAG TPA: hypothetical protein VJ085_09770 [Candidatus Acidoferrales bacterium]|nr:hypothetical protein [Candidatus Acidoferrales bacterium]
MGVEEIVGQLKKRFIIVAVILLVALGALWLLLSGARSLKDTLVRQNETRAQQTLATINQALKAYNEKYGGYPDDLRRLRGGEEGRPESAPPEKARLLDTALAQDQFERNGYRFRYRGSQPEQRWAATVQLYSGYRLTAEPLTPGAGGNAFYYADENGKIHVRPGQAAGPTDPLVQ